MMKSGYERLEIALNHHEPDRVPLDFGATGVTGINIHALKKLRSYLGLPTGQEKFYDRIGQLGKIEEDLIETLEIDVKPIDPDYPKDFPTTEDGLEVVWKDGDYYKLKDEFGVGYKMHSQSGHWFDPVDHPLADVTTPEEVKDYSWPDPIAPSRFRNIKGRVEKYKYEDRKGYVHGRMNAGMWEHLRWMTGDKKFFMDMIRNKKLIHALMERMTYLKKQYWKRVLEIVGKDALVISTADDLGVQDRLLVSKKLYKELIYPYHKELFQFIHNEAKTRVYIFFHCDGAIRPVIPLLIDAGVDILNPVQVSAKGIDDTAKLKKEFGDYLTFWGGGCDPKVLSQGSPEMVKEEARRRINDLSPNGGYIFAPIHNIQEEVPPENIVAMWEALQEFGEYS